MNFLRFVFSLFVTASLLSLPAFAQNDPAAMERMDRLEHDIELLQRQVAQGGTPMATSSDATAAPLPANSNQIDVRLSAIEDQMRELRGSVEQAQNEARKASENLDKFQKDTEFRLNQAAATPVPAPVAALAPVAAADTAAAAPAPAPAEGDAASQDSNDPTRGDPSKKKALPGALKSNFPTPREHYNYAFRLLNQTQYEQAAASFDDFVAKYPKDALVGNAYYWGGETYYIRRDYVKSADYFRQGYEAMPEGPKAADNLYKLALSLNALDRAKEGCVVLQEVVAKFKKTSTNISAKAEQELKSSTCHKG